jgi:hypothetical protein
MAVPMIVRVTPSICSTAGGNLVSVYGGGFRVRTIPTVITGPVPAPPPTVRVTFGGSRSRRVLVPRSNRLLVELPPSPLPPVLARSSAALHTFTAGTRTIGRASGSFVTDGFVPGCRAVVTGSASNDSTRANRSYSVATVSTSSLVLEASESLVDEPAIGATVTCRTYGEGLVDVTVENLDDNGDLIAGETVTALLALRYRRVQLAEPAELQRLVRELVRLLRLGTIANVSTSTHTDYDSEPLSLGGVELAELPGLALIGPELDENRFFSVNYLDPESGGEAGEAVQRRVPYTVDLGFSIVGVSDSKSELLSLQSLVVQFFHRNKRMRMLRDATDPSMGEVEYEMDWSPGGLPKVAGIASDSNLRSFSGTFVVRGFDIEDLPGFEDEGIVDRTAQVEEIRVTSIAE